MELTTILAQLWGPAILLVGMGVFMSGSYYLALYRDLEKNSLSVLTFGMLAVVGGIAQILFHNVWGTLPQIIVSLLGWGLLLKGALFIVAPRFVDQVGDGWADRKLIPVAGILMLLVGGYLSWIGYFA